MKSRVSFCTRMAILFLICSPTLFSQTEYSDATVDQSQAQKWREDLSSMSKEMIEWHRDLFHAVTRVQFDQAIARLEHRIPSLTRDQIIVQMARIVAMVGDGHTNIDPSRDPMVGFRTYPIKLHFFRDGLCVWAATREYAAVVGSRVLKIGSFPVEAAYRKVEEIIGRDNEMDARFFAQFLLTMPEVLHGLGILSDMDKGTYTVEVNGHEKTISLKPFGPFDLLAHDTDTSWLLSGDWIDARQNAQLPTPLWLKDPRDKFWFQYLPDSRTVYVQFNQVGNKEDETVEQFCSRLFPFVDEHAVDRFVLDLRLNRGGNGQLNRPLLLGIIRSTKIDQKGKLFAIVGRATWSAAQSLVNDLEKYTNVIFVGEPTGGKPNSYGDSHKIILPNSGVAVRVSTLWWQGDERDNRPWTAPKLAADLTFQEYRDNIDPALNVIFHYAPTKSLDELLADVLSKGSRDSLKAEYEEWKSNPLNEYVDPENQLISLGYRLMGMKQMENAIAVFRLCTEVCPQSWNAFDSLGEAYMNAGETALSIQNYQKSLELNPRNFQGRETLRRLHSK